LSPIERPDLGKLFMKILEGKNSSEVKNVKEVKIKEVAQAEQEKVATQEKAATETSTVRVSDTEKSTGNDAVENEAVQASGDFEFAD
jgi:hypothetical protein